jgi:hypothetical protein
MLCWGKPSPHKNITILFLTDTFMCTVTGTDTHISGAKEFGVDISQVYLYRFVQGN